MTTRFMQAVLACSPSEGFTRAAATSEWLAEHGYAATAVVDPDVAAEARDLPLDAVAAGLRHAIGAEALVRAFLALPASDARLERSA